MKNEPAVSSVVSVVLLLLLVIVVSSIMAVVLSTATNEAVDSTPNALFTISSDNQTLYHGGGDVLYKDRLVFYSNGLDITRWIEIDSVDTWTEWRTGQAIKLPVNHYVANLTIIALDSLGRQQLLYQGSTIVSPPLPPYTATSTTIPFPTPIPTVIPTPPPVYLPNADFTWEVTTGTNILKTTLPLWLTADAYIIITDSQAEVKFTAIENRPDVSYSWSSSPGATIVNPANKISRMIFTNRIPHSVTLTVSNTSGSNSSTKIFSIRDRGHTAMTWLRHDGWSHKKSGNNYDYPNFEAINKESGEVTYKWNIVVGASTSRDDNNDKYDLKYKIESFFIPALVGENNIMHQNIWYHVAGTYILLPSNNKEYIYFDGSNIKTRNTIATVMYLNKEGEIIIVDSTHFEYDDPMFHQFIFPLTDQEIALAFNAEKFVHGR